MAKGIKRQLQLAIASVEAEIAVKRLATPCGEVFHADYEQGYRAALLDVARALAGQAVWVAGGGPC